MKDHYCFTDEEFENLFANLEFPADMFDHEAHLRLAWIHISRYGLEKAEVNISSQLKDYVNHLGAGDKYNETLTIAAVKAVHHFYQRNVNTSFKKFIIENIGLLNNFKGLMRQHYSRDIFNSDQAKKEYLEPELLAFD